MSQIEWSDDTENFYVNLSIDNIRHFWSCDVEIDSQTIASGYGKEDKEAMINAIADLENKIQELLQLKSSMVLYLIEGEE